MGSPRSAWFLVLALAGGTPARTAPDPAALRLFEALPAGAASTSRAAVPGIALVTVDRAALAALRGSTGARVRIPVPGGAVVTLALEPFELLAPGATVTTTDDRGVHPLAVDAMVLRGGVEGEPGSIAVLTLSSETVYGAILAGSARYAIMPAPAGAGTGLQVGRPVWPGEHAVADERIQRPGAGRFECEVGDPDWSAREVESLRARLARPAAPFPRPEQLECRYAIDCDYELYANTFAGNTAAGTSYLLTLYGTVAAIYERDVNSTFRITYLNFWTTSADPYSATDAQGTVAQMANWWGDNQGAVVRDLAGVASGRIGGGFAYIGGLCSKYNGYAAYGISGTNSYPTNQVTYDAYLVAHEIGHNFGSAHTQSCYWQSVGLAPPGALLDSCYTAEGDCYSGPVGICPAALGTIMSYCPLSCVRMEFHDACKKVIRSGAEGSCLAPSAIQPPRDVVANLVGAGVAIGWNPSPTAGVIRYDVYRSLYMLDAAPPLLGSTTSTGFVDPAPGSYFYKVRAKRASDQSAFSREVKAVPCAPGAARSYLVGNTPRAVVAGDFYQDGYLDLAVANAGGNNVSILVAQRCGLCSSAFATAVNYAVGSSPDAIAAADLNGDGVLDLVVANGGESAVSVLLGNGPGGVGDGSFAAAVPYPASAGPAGLVIGDFDEDGIADLAVACTDGDLALLRGQGSGGVGAGSFGAAALVALGSPVRGVVSGDFNHDGILDLAAACDAGVKVLIGQGSAGVGYGSFAPAVSYPAGTGPAAIAAGDFDHDGILDLAVANAGSGDVSVLRGQGSGGPGDGTFGPPSSYAAGGSPSFLCAGDWNQDGSTDLAVASPGSGTLSILDGAGGGSFGSPRVVAGAGSAPGATLAGEFTDDSRPELVAVDGVAAGKVAVIPVSCTGPYPLTVQLTSPNGGETLTYPGERTFTWSKGAGVAALNVEISRNGGVAWETIATNQTGSSFTWSGTPPTTTQGRVRVYDPEVQTRRDASDANFYIIPLAALSVRAEDRGLKLSMGPNPARGEVAVWLELPQGGPGELRLFDLAGRTVASRAVAGLGDGPRRVVLAAPAALPSGLYLVRVTQGGRAAAARVVVLR